MVCGIQLIRVQVLLREGLKVASFTSREYFRKRLDRAELELCAPPPMTVSK